VEKERVCVKSADAKFGNDPIFNMRTFDESSRWIGWSKDELSHSLALQLTAVRAVRSAVASVKPREAAPLYVVPVESRWWLFFR
jgi:hypothetical protein